METPMRLLPLLAYLLLATFFASPGFGSGDDSTPVTPDTEVTDTQCRELNRVWRAKYHSDFHVAWRLEPFECPSAMSKLARALQVLEQNRDRFGFYEWSREHVAAVTYDRQCTSVAQMESNGTMNLCPGFFRYDDFGRASTFVHEAAHNRTGDPKHATCSRGENRGVENGCDEQFYEGFRGGAYSFEILYYDRELRQTTNNVDRGLLRALNNYTLNNRFNQITPAQIRRWER